MSKYISQLNSIVQQSNNEYAESFVVYLSGILKIPKTELHSHLKTFKNSKTPFINKSCKYIFNKGKNKDTQCSKKTKDGEMYCKKHSKNIIENKPTTIEEIFEKDILLIEEEPDETNWEDEIEDYESFDDN